MNLMASQQRRHLKTASRKDNLRARMRSARQNLDPDHRDSQSLLIIARVMDLFRNAPPQKAGIYLATRYEVNLDPLIQQWHQQGAEIYLPHLDDRKTPFHRFDSWDTLEPGPLDLRQPPQGAPGIEATQLDIIILPGLAFDYTGNRLGHGGGWYDRLLEQKAENPNPVTIGVCFAEQFVDEVPCETFDVRMDIVVTPSDSWMRGGKLPGTYQVNLADT